MVRLACCAIAAAALFADDTVLVPSGSYIRGRTFDWPDYNMAWYPNPAKDDQPARTVTLDAFHIDRAEVTNAAYAEFVSATKHRAPYHWVGGRPAAHAASLPVTNVSWDDAAAYCTWRRRRLPTEAEWERAARGASVETGMYPWGDRAITAADAVYNRIDGPEPVCSKTPDSFNLCDMVGNVWEWTSDWYGRDYYAVSPERNPSGPDTGLYRALRGGSWFDVPPLFLTTSYRSWARQSERSPTIGFRCARDANQGSVSTAKERQVPGRETVR
jgi:formylglycine-generating enzyme required for sulfatase activity